MTARILLAALILAGTVALAWYGTRWVNRMGHPAPTQPDEPDEREGHEDPVEHEGATEEWSPLASAGDFDQAGHDLLGQLKASALAEVALHDALADELVAVADRAAGELEDLCGTVAAAIDGAYARFLKALNLDAHGKAWIAAGLPGDTGEFDRRHLDAMLVAA